jgi:hypothetical protein
MTGSGSHRPSLRASDADRERVVRLLRDCAVEGRLTHESFVRRIDLALRARTLQTLDDVVADLPPDRRSGTAGPVRDVKAVLAAWGRPRLPLLRMPPLPQRVLTIGRGGGCDLVLTDLTVSRRHAVLRKFGDQWFLEDLGSTNGTRLNGWRLRTAASVQHGDLVGFGRLAFRIQDRERGFRT